MEEKFKENSGITLIALVVTIIVLLILAGVSIAMLTGDNGILKQATNAKEKTENAQMEEENTLTNYEQIINANTGVTLETITGTETSNTVTQDSLGNRVVVPAGFRVVNPTDNVEDGIIIEDVSHGATEESQFVWIPVGKIVKKDGSHINITLGRYVFNSDGSINKELSKSEALDELRPTLDASTYYFEATKGNFTNNSHSLDIEKFIYDTNKMGGYYIARYEARTKNERKNKDEPLTEVTVKKSDFVYNNITQAQATQKCQDMYKENTSFTSDLINSYAWDTALVFIQECSENQNYSRQNSINKQFENKGTINTESEDKICNIYDMASNCYEWTTETHSDSEYPCVFRGGVYNDNSYYTSVRYNASITSSPANRSFRPILYL